MTRSLTLAPVTAAGSELSAGTLPLPPVSRETLYEELARRRRRAQIAARRALEESEGQV